MQLATLAKFVQYILVFYYLVVRPRRYVQFISKLVFFLALFIPGTAHLSADWDFSRHSEHENNIKSEVSAGLLVAALVSSIPTVLLLDLTSSWRGVARLVAMSLVLQVVLGAGIMSWNGSEITLAHGYFLLSESPWILATYIARLPWDGWGQLKSLGESAWRVFWETVLEEKVAPTLALRRSDGAIVANITASL